MMFLFLVALSTSLAEASFSCKDQHNFNVPWFSAYKMPKMAGETVGSKDGTGFYYLDSADRSAFKASPVAISESHQAIGYTLDQYYSNKNNKNVLHVFYNDEVPGSVELDQDNEDPKAVEFGHTKGAVIFDGTSGTGVWLIHSVPKFPPPDSYAYPSSGVDYGQTFLCLTLNAAEVKLLGTVLFYNHPQIYSKSEPSWVAAASPDMHSVLSGQYNSDASRTSLHQTITVVGNQANPSKMEVFAKTHLFKDDLWMGLVAPVLGSLEVETWRRGSEIPLDCHSAHPVYDAQNIQVGGTGEFHYTKDHSKYARTMGGTKKVCIGDINRMTTQYVRGGGTVCLADDQLWHAFEVFKQTQTC